MSNDKRMLARMRELCAELSPEDGLDANEIKRRRAREGRKEDRRKTRQLCGQVARAVGLALGSSHDTLLQGVVVERVEPAPDANRLRVWVSWDETGDALSPDVVVGRLTAAAPWVRSEVAGTITRKRVPELVFAWSMNRGGAE
jgi:ribosome-binding factor A